MFRTNYGNFSGDTWEDVCQICFKTKYGLADYQEIPASPGDYGIEGYTGEGDVFQCYCPDANYNPDLLYEKQRDKISKDVDKLETYQTELIKILNGIKIKRWIFVTPEYNRKTLLDHCVKKTNEIKAKKLPHIDSDFKILVQDGEFYAKELPIALQQVNTKMELTSELEITEEKIIEWKESKIDLVDHATKKHEAIVVNTAKDREIKINKLTNNSIKNFLKGEGILKTWETFSPKQYEKFLKVKAQFEEKVEEKCLNPANDSNIRFDEIKKELTEQLKTEFNDLEITTINDLSTYVIADWILRCPISFE